MIQCSVGKLVFLLFCKDPEVAQAFQEISANPANIGKYQNNPKVQEVLAKLSKKFGGSPPGNKSLHFRGRTKMLINLNATSTLLWLRDRKETRFFFKRRLCAAFLQTTRNFTLLFSFPRWSWCRRFFSRWTVWRRWRINFRRRASPTRHWLNVSWTHDSLVACFSHSSSESRNVSRAFRPDKKEFSLFSETDELFFVSQGSPCSHQRGARILRKGSTKFLDKIKRNDQPAKLCVTQELNPVHFLFFFFYSVIKWRLFFVGTIGGDIQRRILQEIWNVKAFWFQLV